ncbi:MAG: class I SAM-dependent methyltransferase [Candidatus Lokiarchaeia archaeon]
MIGWDDYWKKYSVSKAEKWLILERDRIINSYLDKLGSSKKRIIEIGCGYGSNIKLIKDNRNDVECYALDNSNVAIELVKEDIPNAFLSDCRNTPFADNEFDLIFSAGLMEHLDEKPFLKEINRILKDNGYVITFVPAKFSLWKLYQLLHFGSWQHGYEKSYTYNGLKSLFQNNGFSVIEILGIDPFSINGFIMKLFNITFTPIFKRSFLKSGYLELCVIAKIAGNH